ncbi:MAG TPA: ABC transporter substrate-binding protein [Alcanivoracaceae bacterium]|nr:ABC transporter substrate-binding protein [Alcanivoracaceae bacterium]
MSLRNKVRNVVLAGAVSSLLLSPMALAATIKIGYTGPLSGGAALYGQDALDGLQMAANEINASGGLTVAGKKYDVEIVSLDDKYAPSQTAMNAKRLVQRDKVKFIYTPHSGGAFALQGFNERSNFLLMAYSSVPKITEQGNALTVRIPPTYTGYVEPFVGLGMEHHGKHLAVASGTHDYARMWSQAIIPAWEKAGGEVVANNPMDYNKSADFYTGVSRSLAANPDVMFVGGASEPTGLVVRQARELGFKGGFILMGQAKLIEVAEVAGGLDQLEGAIGVPPLTAHKDVGAKTFVEKRNKIKENSLSWEVAMHYTSLYMLTEAMKVAESVDDARKVRAAFGQALTQLPDEYNTFNVKEITEEGGLVHDSPIAMVRGGELEMLTISEYENYSTEK